MEGVKLRCSINMLYGQLVLAGKYTGNKEDLVGGYMTRVFTKRYHYPIFRKAPSGCTRNVATAT